MKAIIIDDENESREVLRLMLQKHCDTVSLIGEATNGDEGLELIRRAKPDLVFLDVEMPGKNGFQVLEEIPEVDFALIFATAYNKYAIQAFEFSTVDFLLKPIEKVKLIRAVMKAQEFRRLKEIEKQYEVLLEIVKAQGSDDPYNHRISFSNQQEIVFVYLKDLIRIEANGNCSSAYALGHPKGISIAKNIGEYVKLFKDIPFFFQTHRGHLVNLYHIHKIVKKDGPSLLVNHPAGGPHVSVPIVSKYLNELLERLNQLKSPK